MVMAIVLGQVIQLILFAAVGYILCKYKIAGSSHGELLSSLEVYVFLPAISFSTFSSHFTLEYISENYKLLIISVMMLVVLTAVAYPLARLLTKDRYEQTVFHYSLTIPNYGYVGYALTAGVFGQEMLMNVMMFGVPLSVYINSIGFCTLTKSKFSIKKVFNPATIALILGAIVGLSGLQVPTVINSLCEKASACMAPISMLLAGMVISQFDFQSLLKNKPAYIVVLMRLLVIPFAIAMALRLLSLDDMIIPALMIYAMPCGLNTIVFPKLVKENCESGASLAFVSSVLSCATIPLCLYLFC